MANRTHRSLAGHPRSDVVILTAHCTGNTTNDLTIPSGPDGDVEIVSATRTDTGDFDIVFRHKYPELLFVDVVPRGATAGLRGRVVSVDTAAGTASITLEVGSTATDPATTDTIQFLLYVRNSGRN